MFTNKSDSRLNAGGTTLIMASPTGAYMHKATTCPQGYNKSVVDLVCHFIGPAGLKIAT